MKTPPIIGTLAATAAFATTGCAMDFQTDTFKTPVSPTPLYGAEGYLSVVSLMRKSFPDVQWRLVDIVADEKTVAVRFNRPERGADGNRHRPPMDEQSN